MKLYTNFVFLIFLFLPGIAFGKVQEFNKLPTSPFNNVNIDEVFEKSYFLGSWDGDSGEVRKYQNGSTELYLLTPSSIFRNAFLVIPKDHFPSFLDMLHKSAEQFAEVKKDPKDYQPEPIDLKSYLTDYEFIYKPAQSEDSYLCGVTIKDAYVWKLMDDTPNLVIYFRIPKAPKFPFYKDGKETAIFIKDNALAELINILDKANGNNELDLNPDSFQRIGSFPYPRNPLGKQKREVLRYGKGLSTKYYIELSEHYVDGQLYQDYLWIKGIKFNLFKKWINDIYTTYNRIYPTKPKSENDKVYEDIPLPSGLSFGGIITGKFDVDMNVLEGYSLDKENVNAVIHYTTEKFYGVLMRFGNVIVTFDKPTEIKEFIDALGK